MQVGFGVAWWESVLPQLDFTLSPTGTFMSWVDLELWAMGCSSDTPLKNLTAWFGYWWNPIWICTGTKLGRTISWCSPTLTTLRTPLLQECELASSPLKKKCPQTHIECLQNTESKSCFTSPAGRNQKGGERKDKSKQKTSYTLKWELKDGDIPHEGLSSEILAEFQTSDFIAK